MKKIKVLLFCFMTTLGLLLSKQLLIAQIDPNFEAPVVADSTTEQEVTEQLQAVVEQADTDLTVAVAETTQAVSTATTENEKSYFGIYHQPNYDSSTLPPPGHPMQLVVQLFNVKDMDLPLKTFANIDGRLIELTPSRVYLNKDDYPEYVIETHAPAASIDYYFIAYGTNGYVATSEQFSIRRPCLPELAVVNPALDSNPRDGNARLTEIVHKAWDLERELKTYEHAHKLIEAINLELARLDGKR